MARVPGWAAATRVEVVRLEGGITNENYRVDVDYERFVVRLEGRSAHLLGIDRARECAAARMAASREVGPQVVFALPEAGVLVTRFVPGRVLTPEDVRVPEVLARVVAAIVRVHSGPPIPGTFSPFRTVLAYHDTAARHGVALPPSLDDWLALMRRIEARLPRVADVPCHNDLLPNNFVDAGDRIRILDWEYAGMGDPFFDLGNLAANAKLDSEGERRLLELYQGSPSTEAHAHLGLMRLVSDMREAMWGLVQVGISDLAFDFAGYAARHFSRFVTRAATAGVAAWLR
ncbi:MAG: phosphotransferase [Candidatus Rokuibacteriota bacterium]